MSALTGGPAFPEQIAVTPTGDTYSGESGMSLRDYFAATVGSNDLAGVRVKEDREALAGRMEPNGYTQSLDALKFNVEVEAALRYLYADAMLAERAK